MNDLADEMLAAHAAWLVDGAAGAAPSSVRAADKDPQLRALMALAAEVKATLRPIEPEPGFRSALYENLLATAARRSYRWRSLERMPRPSIRPHRPTWDVPRPRPMLRSGAALALASLIVLLLWGRGARPPW